MTSKNPYDTPKSKDHILANESDSATPAHLTFRILAWVFWTALVLSLLWDLIDMFTQGPSVTNALSTGRFVVLIVIAITQVAMVILMRWIVFRFTMRNVDHLGWKGAARCIAGTVVIYGMIRVLGITGDRLWSDSGRWLLYFLFAAPSVILAALCIPSSLMNYISTGKCCAPYLNRTRSPD